MHEVDVSAAPLEKLGAILRPEVWERFGATAVRGRIAGRPRRLECQRHCTRRRRGRDVLLDDQALDRRLGQAGHERVRDAFLGDRHLTQYVDLFADLLQG